MFQYRSNNVFEMKYRCHSMAVKGAAPGMDNGGKILLPPSALDFLSRLQISWPVFFNVRNPSGGLQTNCGVQEFTAEEGTAYFPYWMMRQLNLSEGSLVVVRQVDLLPGSFCKIQPHSKDFLDISNPRAVLEKHLRDYACMSKGDVFQFSYNDKMFAFNVLEVRPGNAVSIVETDMNVDFAPPLDYVEPEYTPVQKKEPQEAELPPDVHVVPSLVSSVDLNSSQGHRLGGKKAKVGEKKVAGPTRTRLTLGTPASAVADVPSVLDPASSQPAVDKNDYWASLSGGQRIKEPRKKK